jgi:sec-independent protein translocase protein TatA
MLTLLAYFGIGTTELIIVGVVVLLLFGNRLPSTMRSLGRGIVEFKKGVQGIEEDVDNAGGTQKPAEPKPQEPTK